MNTYLQQINCPPADIDIGFWKAPQGATVPDDELSFLLVPDAVEARIAFEMSQQVHRAQLQLCRQDTPITCALMATMGGVLPGILLYDHLVQGRPAGTPRIEFGSVGISLYKGPDQRYDKPRINQDVSIPISDKTVLLIDDLGDRGDTLTFLLQHLADKGARQVLTLAFYMKPQALRVSPVDFFFGEVSQDTWIITPREAVETMARRVPVWKQRGASKAECYRRLVDIIGYPIPLVDYYLGKCFTA